MSELRQNIATKEWVIIAPERSNRPEDFMQTRRERVSERFVATCPFCPGNEHMTPTEVCAIRDQQSWSVRAVHNKYPALSRDGQLQYQENGTKRWSNGVGFHDVIIESPAHDLSLAELDVAQVANVMRLYKEIYVTSANDARVELVTLFKNHGPSAGTSLEHPHSQLIATPIVPSHIRQRVLLSQRYYDDHRRCVYCAMLQDELHSGERMVFETKHFAAFVLYAALSPFHLWVLPKQHRSVFLNLDDEQLVDLALMVRTVLRKIHVALDDPDYNFVIRSQPGVPRQTPFFHSYMSIVPRVSTSAGFELGSGMYINTVLPERAAAFLRNTSV